MIDFNLKPQKALHLYIELDKKKPKCTGHDYAIFEKYDGWYGYMDLAEGVIRSRAGRVIPSCEELSKKVLEATKGLDKGVLIFEILIHGVTEFAELNGILNRTVGDYIAKDAYVVCHDYVRNEHVPFRTRYFNLSSTVSFTNDVRLAEYLDVSSCEATWRRLAEYVWSTGGEGIILKRLEAPYSPDKRNFDLMKIKEEVTLDLLAVDVEEGQGKYKDNTGALVCRDKSGKIHTVSGMTDEQRIEWWRNHKTILGKVVEVKAMKVLPDGSLREPRFKAIRHDKSVKDID